MTDRTKDLAFKAGLFGTLGLAALLRLHALGDIAPVQDEYYQIFAAVKFDGLWEFLGLLRRNPLHILADPLTTFAMARLSDGVGWLRLPSVVWGAVGVLALCRLGFESGGRRLALGAALLLAVSMPHIEWSRRVDFYALLAALAALQTGLLLRMLRRPDYWKGYAACATLFIHSHPYAVLAAALHAVYIPVAVSRAGAGRAWRSFLLAWGAAAACFVPWFLYSTSALADRALFDFSGLAWNPTVLEFVAGAPMFLAQASDLHGPVPVRSAAAAWAYAALYCVSMASVLRRRGPAPLVLAHLSVLGGTAAVSALDLFFGYFFAHSQLLFVLPFYLLAVAHGALVLVDAIRSRRREGVYAAACAAAALAVWAVLPVYVETTAAQVRVENKTRRTIDAIRGSLRPGDSLAFEDTVLAQDFLHRFDPEAFRGAGGYSLRKGFLVYDMPPGLRAGPLGNHVVVGFSHEKKARKDVWLFSGVPGDFRVYPPLRSD